MTLRRHVLRILEHLLAVGLPVPVGKLGMMGREIYDRYMPVLRRHAAGDAVPPDDLLEALRGFDCVTMATSDRTLFLLLVAARDACLVQCSWDAQEVERQQDATFFQRIGIPAAEGHP